MKPTSRFKPNSGVLLAFLLTAGVFGITLHHTGRFTWVGFIGNLSGKFS